MSEATFEAATVEEALEQAAAELGVPGSELDHEVVAEKPDFWGTGGGTVVVKAWQRVVPPPQEVAPVVAEPKESVADEVAAADVETEAGSVDAADVETEAESVDAADVEADAEPVDAATDDAEVEAVDVAVTEPEAEPVEAVAAEPASDDERPSAPAGVDGATAEGVDPEAITSLLAQIFHDMEFECTIEIEAEGDGYLATIAGEDKEALLEGNGRCLSALELIVNNAFRHKLPRGSKIRVDAGDFRSRRDEELADLAFQVAHSAKQTGRTQETQPLNPYERRLVHLALAEDPSVSTRSRGSGFLKNVQIIPQGGSSGGGRGRGRRER